jgi:hypothetical protein
VLLCSDRRLHALEATKEGKMHIFAKMGNTWVRIINTVRKILHVDLTRRMSVAQVVIA